MNCCDANGKCTGGDGCAAHRRSCEELGVCQGRTPPCTYADGKTIACPNPAPIRPAQLRLAPGIVEGFKVSFLGTPAQRRELGRFAKSAAWWLLVCGLTGFAAGLVSGALSW